MSLDGAPSTRLFGTDGIRGVANIEPMTPDTVLRVGRALTAVFQNRPHTHQIVIGTDTRRSGAMLEAALAAGVCSMGGNALLVGLMPTPGIAFLTRSLRAAAGVVISASHNPSQDNGIKIFSRDGFKLSDTLEDEIAALVLSATLDNERPTAESIGTVVRLDDARGRYQGFVTHTFPRHLRLDGIKIVLDCANGAASRIAPAVLTALGAEVIPIGTTPNGININLDCGALYPQRVQQLVCEHGAQIGITLDGDADRAILVDETGEIVDGDAILAITAQDRLQKGTLPHKTIVATMMSNLGLEIALRQMGATLVRTPVGDRYVVEAMRRGGYHIGGEQSGHIIFLDRNTTGDGLVTALTLLAILVQQQQPLSQLRQIVRRYPQTLINVRVRERQDLRTVGPVSHVIQQVTDQLGDNGRLFVRYSGTESLLRVMVEGEDESLVRTYGEEVADAVRAHLGAGEAA